MKRKAADELTSPKPKANCTHNPEDVPYNVLPPSSTINVNVEQASSLPKIHQTHQGDHESLDRNALEDNLPASKDGELQSRSPENNNVGGKSDKPQEVQQAESTADSQDHEKESEGNKSAHSERLSNAHELLTRLVVAIEVARCLPDRKSTDSYSIGMQDRIRGICEFIRKEEMMQDPRATGDEMLPFNCVSELDRLHDVFLHTQVINNAYEDAQTALKDTMNNLGAAIQSRTAFLLSDSDDETIPSDVIEIKTRILEARKRVKEAEEHCTKTQVKIEEHATNLNKSLHLPLRMAESALIKMGLLSSNNNPQTGEGKQGEAADASVVPRGDAVPDDDQHSDQRHSAPSVDDSPRGRSWQHKQMPARSRSEIPSDHRIKSRSTQNKKRRNSVPAFNRTQNDRNADALPPLDDICELKRHSLKQARKAIRNLAKERQNDRDLYHQDLTEWLRREPPEERARAKLEFDQHYFLRQGRITKQQILTEADRDLFERQVKELGAQYREEMTSGFSDCSGDGYDDSGFDPRCLVWQLEEERIKRWVDAERERLGLNVGPAVPHQESDWDIQEPPLDSGSRLVLPLGDGFGFHMEDLFEGKQRKKIDDYAQKQNRVRAMILLREPHWWEVCTGV